MVIVLMSGGLDSMVLAERARRAGVLGGCVFVDYGHPAAQQEAWHAFAWCRAHDVRLHVVHVHGLMLGDMADIDAPGLRVVPNRNAVLLGIAANFAASVVGCVEVHIGAIADDAAYPDCSAEWIERLGAAFPMRLSAPLVQWRKAEVVQEARRLGLDSWWSCYGPGPLPCGTCSSCLIVQESSP